MDSTLNDKLIAGLDDELSSLRRELGVNPSDPPASIKRFRARPATIHRLANWRHLAFVGSLLAASMGVAWWWSPSAHTAMMAPSASGPLTQAAPKDGAPTKHGFPLGAGGRRLFLDLRRCDETADTANTEILQRRSRH